MESLQPEMCEGMQNMSESVFVGLCQIVGTTHLVVLRREIKDTKEMVERTNAPNYWLIAMSSGSEREGFRMKGSDVDCMYWPNNHRVLTDISQSEYYNTANTTLILSDSSRSPPGFTLLQLLTPSRWEVVFPACVIINNSICISSSIFRQLTVSTMIYNATAHGPCGSGKIAGVEYDSAFCFFSDIWPLPASSWIDRCQSWPEPEVVAKVVRNGCHFVAIGHPLGLHENEEWRISFSQAEHILVASMNHCQFLTYGLLKLFLKEVINQQPYITNKPLCSYHMKTTIFWAIQQNALPHWCPQNILVGFWICFKLLLKWVYEGICPNFFIPQNNLFLSKIHGSAQYRLFLQLQELYKKGLACLLQSSSIRSYINDALCNPRLSICTDESILMCEIDYDEEFVTEFFKDSIFIGNLRRLTNAIHMIEKIVDSNLTHYQTITLQKFTALILQNTAFTLQNMYTYTSANKQVYIADKVSCHMLKLAAEFGCISDLLYIAMYYYKTHRYRKALSFIEMTKVNLTQPYLMYRGRVLDRNRYTEAVGGKSLSAKTRQAVADEIRLQNKIFYIKELIPEQLSSLEYKMPALLTSVFVMSHFLEFLCYKNINTTLSQTALDELQILVHHDQGLYVHASCRDISWEILGICQQITGNLHAALYSYQNSLAQYPYNKIQNATQKRIHNIVRLTQL